MGAPGRGTYDPSAPRVPCKGCRRLLNRNNTTGYCSTTRECRNIAQRILLGHPEFLPDCKRCGKRLTTGNDSGYCCQPECRNALRREQYQDARPGQEFPPQDRTVWYSYKSIHVGQRFTRWTVIGETYSADGCRWVPVRCDCGTLGEVSASNLLRQGSRSCGCLKTEVMIAKGMSLGARLAIHPPGEGHPNRVELDMDWLRQLHSDGLSQDRVALAMNVSRGTVRRRWCELGYPIAPCQSW